MAKVFERIVIVMLENTMRTSALANSYLNELRKKGVFMTNAQGVTHPSQPNYLCLVSGDTVGIVDDENHYVNWFYGRPVQEGYSLPNIADLLEAQNLSWKCYAEDLPETYKEQLPGHLEEAVKVATYNHKNKATPKPYPTWPEEPFPFTRRHIPFLSFPSIVSNPKRLAKIVNADEFQKDLDNDTLPHYSLYVPNLINNGHTKSDGTFVDKAFYKDLGGDTEQIDQIAAFLQKFLGDDPVGKFPPETLVVLTFDEAYPYQFDYGIYTLLLADFLQAGTINSDPINHYNLLATVEQNFGIGNMKRNDAIAQPYWFLR
ncbi:MAG: alkaline phosphatase family protein [Saprospiraceae bacterium]